jgi:hypothetical protein
MATVLEEYPTEEKRSVMRFLLAEKHTAKYIHKVMFPVYGGKCLSCKRFTTGSRNSLIDFRKSEVMRRRCGSG